MTSITESSQQSELALAAYADFSGPASGDLALVSNIYNFRGSEGLSVITGLGAQLAPPTIVLTEAAPGGELGPDNHSNQILNPLPSSGQSGLKPVRDFQCGLPAARFRLHAAAW